VDAQVTPDLRRRAGATTAEREELMDTKRAISRLEGLVSDAKRQRIEANGALLLEDLAQRRTVFRTRPLLLEFSSNNLCNLKCVMCRPDGLAPLRLPPEVVRDVLVDQLMPDAMVLLPSSGSEPFLGDIEVLAEGAIRHEVQLFLITNGTLMTRDKLESVAPAIGRLHISVDGHRAELYEPIRVGANFDELVRNIADAGFVAHRDGFELLMSTVFSMALVDEVDEYIRFAAGLGADAVELQRLRHATGEASDIDPFQVLEPSRIEAVKELALKTAEEEGIDIHIAFHPTVFGGFNKRPRKQFLHGVVEETLLELHPELCFMSCSYFKVNPNGRVQPCCAAGASLFMGSVLEQGVEEIWNGRPFQDLRQAMYDQLPPTVCQTCPTLKRGLCSSTA
jgi:radical SAM protein with 4Fe4S-binding SPASM domain